MLNFKQDYIATPTGQMLIITDDNDALRCLEWTDLTDRMERLFSRQYKGQKISLSTGKAPAHIRDALQAYFDGSLHALDRLTTKAGGTDFQRRVWTALRSIPVGQTRSYLDIAIAIDQPKAVRAIGLANGANPIGIVVPCHRVIGANGNLTGYGGGLDRKLWLLRHEKALSAELI